MKISVEHLRTFDPIDEYRLSISPQDPNFASIYKTSDAPSTFGYHITSEHLKVFEKKGIKTVYLHVTGEFKKKLEREFPDSYIRSHLSTSLHALTILSEQYLLMNKKSGKKRFIRTLDDICTPMPTNSHLKNILIPYGDVITQKHIASLKRLDNQHELINYQDSESGILLFVPDVANMKLRVDLIAMVSMGFTKTEFFLEEEVEDGVRTYIEKKPKMVILGMLDTNILAKEFQMLLQEHDPYFKRINYNKSPSVNRDEEIAKLKSLYDSDYCEAMDADNAPKSNLPADTRKEIMDSIYQLQSNFSKKAFIDKAFAVKKLEQIYNIQVVWQPLMNIRQKNIDSFPAVKLLV